MWLGGYGDLGSLQPPSFGILVFSVLGCKTDSRCPLHGGGGGGAGGEFFVRGWEPGQVEEKVGATCRCARTKSLSLKGAEGWGKGVGGLRQVWGEGVWGKGGRSGQGMRKEFK